MLHTLQYCAEVYPIVNTLNTPDMLFVNTLKTPDMLFVNKLNTPSLARVNNDLLYHD